MAKSFRELAEECNSLPIKEVLEKVGCVFTGYGPNLKCKSPFRGNSSLGSFNINTVRNVFHDWKLDIVGGPVKFYMTYYNLDFVESVKQMADDYNLGSFQGRVSNDVKVAILQPPIKVKPLNLELIDRVYREFLDMLDLSEEDEALLKVREFSKEEIIFYKFKTFPRRTLSFRKAFEEKIKEIYETEDVLFEVPGFFKKSGEPFSFGYQSGIIIPCYNYLGQITGLQIRKREKDVDNKYVWFSSAYCLKNDPKGNYLEDGMSPGSPAGFEIGKLQFTKKMFITEGFFKAVAIRKRYKMSVITIQGVGNWRPLIGQIEGLREKFSNFDSVIIAYDSDMCYNLNVSNQAMKLGSALMEKGINVEYALWHYNEDTKGIDDLIYSMDDIRKVIIQKPFLDFQAGVQKMNTEVDMDSPKEDIYKSFMKNIMEPSL